MTVQCMRVSLDAPLCSVDFATRNRIANLVEQYVPHMLMQSNGQSTSTLCSDRRETRAIVKRGKGPFAPFHAQLGPL